MIAFQSWIGVGDTQVLVNPTNGRVLSIDHGECFQSAEILTDPVPNVLQIHGVQDTIGKDTAYMRSALEDISAITDRELIESVSRIPSGAPWNSPAERRAQIARWLAYRRDRLTEVMNAWLNF